MSYDVIVAMTFNMIEANQIYQIVIMKSCTKFTKFTKLKSSFTWWKSFHIWTQMIYGDISPPLMFLLKSFFSASRFLSLSKSKKFAQPERWLCDCLPLDGNVCRQREIIPIEYFVFCHFCHKVMILYKILYLVNICQQRENIPAFSILPE